MERATDLIPDGNIRARRGRRTFRFLLGASILTTASLWFADQYLRLPRLETMFRMTRTLPAPSARAVLRNVARQDARQNSSPNPRYLEALGDVEEPDLAPSVYEQSFRLDSRNALLAVKSGCALFHLGRFIDARDRFREAAALSPPNVLPRYLEAAALCASLSEKEDVGDVLAILARANASDVPVILPVPLWHVTLPEGGVWQVRMNREMTRWVLAPLYVMADLLRERARREVLSNRGGPWREWSGLLETVGRRLIQGGQNDRMPDLEQILAGINLIRTAREIRADLSPPGRQVPPREDQGANVLHQAASRAADFMNTWEQRVADYEHAARQPVWWVIATLILYGFLYLLSGLLARFFGKQWRAAKALPWSLLHVLPPAVTALGLGVLLLAVSLTYPLTLRAAETFRLGWYLAIVLSVGTTMGVSVWLATRPASGAGQSGRFTDRISYGLGVFRRQMGSLNGTAVIMICFWLLLFRVMWNAYPFQFSLIVPGLSAEEMELAAQLRNLLLTAGGGA